MSALMSYVFGSGLYPTALHDLCKGKQFCFSSLLKHLRPCGHLGADCDPLAWWQFRGQMQGCELNQKLILSKLFSFCGLGGGGGGPPSEESDIFELEAGEYMKSIELHTCSYVTLVLWGYYTCIMDTKAHGNCAMVLATARKQRR